MNHRENYKIANPETDYFVPRKLQNCENKKKRNFPACRAWPGLAELGLFNDYDYVCLFRCLMRDLSPLSAPPWSVISTGRG